MPLCSNNNNPRESVHHQARTEEVTETLVAEAPIFSLSLSGRGSPLTFRTQRASCECLEALPPLESTSACVGPKLAPARRPFGWRVAARRSRLLVQGPPPLSVQHFRRADEGREVPGEGEIQRRWRELAECRDAISDALHCRHPRGARICSRCPTPFPSAPRSPVPRPSRKPERSGQR